MNARGDGLVREDVLARRLLGTISHFRGHDPALYPTISSIKLVKVRLSPRQFSEYTNVRVAERRREEAARRFAASRKNAGVAVRGENSGVGMRPFSRPACTFVFPEGIPRPRMGDIAAVAIAAAAAAAAAASPSSASGVKASSVEAAYSRALDGAIDRLRALPAGPLASGAPSGLAELSPKFDEIVRRLGALDRGSAIVYSQFRRAEGVAILAVALEANGFVQLDVVSGAASQLVVVLKRGDERIARPTAADLAAPRYILYSNDDRAVADQLLAMFNDRPEELVETVRASAVELFGGGDKLGNLRGELIRAMLITKSGAEGISTRNVRQVHIVEPYWHMNRANQVVGRARRAFSHHQLPPEERNVEVFLYLATFSADQAKQHAKDEGLTSDEHVFSVAQRKQKLLRQIQSVMRRASVDCAAHRDHLEPGEACLEAPGSGDDAISYHAELAKDLAAQPARKLVAVRRNGTLFYADMATGELFDHEALKERKQLVGRGTFSLPGQAGRK